MLLTYTRHSQSSIAWIWRRGRKACLHRVTLTGMQATGSAVIRAHRPLSMLFAPGTDLGCVCVGLDATNVAAGNLARFELIFKLTSDVNSI